VPAIIRLLKIRTVVFSDILIPKATAHLKTTNNKAVARLCAWMQKYITSCVKYILTQLRWLLRMQKCATINFSSSLNNL